MPGDPGASGIQTAKAPKRVFQIAYDERLRFTRKLLLESRGYEVDSVTGNEAAFSALTGAKRYDVFIVGHADSWEHGLQMVAWLRKIPGCKDPGSESTLAIGAGCRLQRACRSARKNLKDRRVNGAKRLL